MLSLDNESMRLYAFAAVTIALHMLLLGAITGAVRTKCKAYVNPEDAKTLKGDQVETDHPDVLRTKRAHQNAIENAVPFFALAFLYALTNPSRVGAEAYYGTFVAARILHSIFYLFGRQPFRTITFAIGCAALVGMAVRILIVAT